MLKVKDNVDLRELEKYGFEYQTNWALKRYVKNNVYVFENNHIQSEEFCKRNNCTFLKPRYLYIKNGLLSNDLVGLDEVVFELIQDGLIEKVEG